MKTRTFLAIPMLVALWAATTGIAQVTDAAISNPFEILRGGSLSARLAGEQPEFLDPDEAFVWSAQLLGDKVRTYWRVAEGYYLYQNKFTFSADGPAEDALGAPVFPPSETKDDEFFGEVQIYKGDFEIDVPFAAMAVNSEPFALKLGYQGCAEAGICYPPIKKTVMLTSGTPPAASSVPPMPVQDRIAAQLASGKWLLLVTSFFGFGLLLAFTPCVLPMIPILSGIIVGQGERLTRRSAFTLSLTYVVSMAAIYAIAGALAGVFGHNLQASFQHPWVLIGFSAVFVLLALSMFGFFELQLPSAWQGRFTDFSNRHRGGTYGGVAVMGALSAIIVGPCVAPPLAGALIYIGETGDAVLGGVALFAMALGMGLPLLVVGSSAGSWLPRAGAWMDTVKRVFGVVLIGVAIWLLARIVSPPLILGMWALLLIVSAVYMGALEQFGAVASGWQRLWKGIGFAMLVYGVALLVGAAGGADNVLQPLSGFSPDAPQTAEKTADFHRVKSLQELRGRLRDAAQPAILDFYADWCIECKQMERHTFSDRDVQAALADVLLLQADVTANDVSDRELLKSLGLYGPPAILFFGADGEERRGYRLVGFVGPERFRAHLQQAVAVR